MSTSPESEAGSSFYEDAAVRDAYLAHRQDALSPNVTMEEPAFLAELGRLGGERLLDLGCGDAAFATVALDAGAGAYVGIDGSAGMVAAALQRALPDRATVIEREIETAAFPERSFDLVTSRMTLHYIEHLDPVVASVHSWLQTNGRLIFSVVHPVITSFDSSGEGPRQSWTVDDYFVPGPRRRTWFGQDVVWHHRTVEDYVTLLTGAGFEVTALRECAPVPELLDGQETELIRRRRVPVVLLLAARRPN
jgi:SAM-dependent methyltransferase